MRTYLLCMTFVDCVWLDDFIVAGRDSQTWWDQPNSIVELNAWIDLWQLQIRLNASSVSLSWMLNASMMFWMSAATWWWSIGGICCSSKIAFMSWRCAIWSVRCLRGAVNVSWNLRWWFRWAISRMSSRLRIIAAVKWRAWTCWRMRRVFRVRWSVVVDRCRWRGAVGVINWAWMTRKSAAMIWCAIRVSGQINLNFNGTTAAAMSVVRRSITGKWLNRWWRAISVFRNNNDLRVQTAVSWSMSRRPIWRVDASSTTCWTMCWSYWGSRNRNPTVTFDVRIVIIHKTS